MINKLLIVFSSSYSMYSGCLSVIIYVLIANYLYTYHA